MGPNSLSKLLGSFPIVKQPLFTQRPKKYFMVRRLQWLLLLLYNVPDRLDGLLRSIACIVSSGDYCHDLHDSAGLSCCQLLEISSAEQALMLFMIILVQVSLLQYINCANHLRQEKRIQSSGPCLD